MCMGQEAAAAISNIPIPLSFGRRFGFLLGILHGFFWENLFCFNCFEYSNKKSTEDKGVFQGELNTNVV